MTGLRLWSAAVLVVGLTFVLAGPAGSAPRVRCQGQPATIVGTAGDDVLVGTKHRDVIAGLAGNDRIEGRGGKDIICGGDGSDTAVYANANKGVAVDLATGIVTGQGHDRLSEIENVIGSSFADALAGDAGANSFAGLGGDDTIDGGGGADTADYSAAPAAVNVDLAAGTATGDGSDALISIENATGSSFDDDLFGSDAANRLTGGGGSDLLQSFGGDDQLVGLAGNDILRAGDGNDAADGGDGTDACVDAEVRAACEQGGGVFTALLSTDIDYTDPAMDYIGFGWQMEYATCLKLLTFADNAPAAAAAVPIPEAATGLPLVSTDGRTYTFTVRDGLRFAPPSGEVVTAETYKHVFDRLLSSAMQSPAVPFFSDVTNVTATGQTLTVTLAQPAPDFVARMTIPFTCAVPLSTPFTPVNVPGGAGPYSIVSRSPNVQFALERNPNYRGRRPSNFDRIVYRVGDSLDSQQSQLEAGTADYAPSGIPSASYAAVGAAYGPGSPAAAAGRQRFFVNPLLAVNYVALNTSRPLFANQTLRQAVAYAVDRETLAGFAIGAYGATAKDQYLSPGTPGYVDEAIYPLHADTAKAAMLAASQGVTPATPVTAVLYSSNGGSAPARAAAIRDELAPIGITVDVHLMSRTEQITRDGTRGEPFDMTTEGWVNDWNDPADVINALLDGGNIHAQNNVNVSYFDDPTFNARMRQANALLGQARYDAYATLEHDLVRAAPLVAYSTTNARDYFSDRIGCQQYGSFGMNLGALCVH